MLDPKLFCDLFKVTGFNIFCFTFLELCHEFFIRKNIYRAVHGIVFIFGYSDPFSFMLTTNEIFLHILYTNCHFQIINDEVIKI